MKKAGNRISRKCRTTAEGVRGENPRKKRKREAEEMFKVIMAENCLKIMADMKPQIRKLRQCQAG